MPRRFTRCFHRRLYRCPAAATMAEPLLRLAPSFSRLPQAVKKLPIRGQTHASPRHRFHFARQRAF